MACASCSPSSGSCPSYAPSSIATRSTAFTATAKVTHLRTSSEVDALFITCVRQAGVPADSSARYSPHSFRRYLACALKAQGVADSTIQALLRWKTAESLKLYSFLNWAVQRGHLKPI